MPCPYPIFLVCVDGGALNSEAVTFQVGQAWDLGLEICWRLLTQIHCGNSGSRHPIGICVNMYCSGKTPSCFCFFFLIFFTSFISKETNK